VTFELLDHTADLWVRLRAPDEATLYDTAVQMIGRMVVGDSEIAERAIRRIAINAIDDAEKLFRFTRELVYLFDAEGFVPARLVDLETLEVAGESFDQSRHVPEHHAKALTRHRYRFQRTDDGYEVDMVFDL
jgi:SHS2 domain-containing protein